MNKQLCSGYDTSKFSPLCKPFTESAVNEELVKWAISCSSYSETRKAVNLAVTQ